METVTVLINGTAVEVPAGCTAAAAISRAGVSCWRHSITAEPRAPLCGMGVCQECRVTVDKIPDRLSCRIVCREGMRVETA